MTGAELIVKMIDLGDLNTELYVRLVDNMGDEVFMAVDCVADRTDSFSPAVGTRRVTFIVSL